MQVDPQLAILTKNQGMIHSSKYENWLLLCPESGFAAKNNKDSTIIFIKLSNSVSDLLSPVPTAQG